VLAEEGATAEIEMVRIKTPAEAAARRFLGSPTVRVDGADVDPAARAATDYGLSCRVYDDAGTRTHYPPEAMVRAAVKRAAGN